MKQPDKASRKKDIICNSQEKASRRKDKWNSHDKASWHGRKVKTKQHGKKGNNQDK